MAIHTPTLYIQWINAMKRKISKKGITLVELVAAMALTAIFALACVMLILPVTKIYRHTLAESRAQLVADTVVDSLRAECSKAIITSTGDVWIANPDNYVGSIMTTAEPSKEGGSVLIFRRNETYCETIASTLDYTIDDPDGDIYKDILEKDMAEDKYKSVGENSESVYSRSIYNMDPSDREAGIIHYGYYKNVPVEVTTFSGQKYTYVCPQEYYDFTNPYSKSTYQDYKVRLNFHNIGFDSNDIPIYVICDVNIIDEDGSLVYTRKATICF